jgi:hypothetical protein
LTLPHRPDDGVDGLADTELAGPLDAELRQLADDVGGAEQPLRIAHAARPFGGVGGVVAHDEDRPRGRQGVRRAGEEAAAIGPGQVDEQHEHEVEGVRRRPVVHEVGLHPRDALRHASLLGPLAGPGQRHVGEVHRGDPPPALCQPDRVPSFAGAEVERRPGGRVAHFLAEEGPGVDVPQQRDGAVALVPVLPVQRLWERKSGPRAASDGLDASTFGARAATERTGS